MIDKPQRAALSLGKTGCYFLSILRLSEGVSFARLDPLAIYEAEVRAGTLGQDCMVLDAGAILWHVTGIPWTCFKAGEGKDSGGQAYALPLEYICKAGELEILRYERQPEFGDTSSTERAHFVVGNGEGALEWDPMGTSHTVAVGRIVSKRIFRRR